MRSRRCACSTAPAIALVVVTNQPGIAGGRFTRADFARLQRALAACSGEAGVELAGFYACPHAPAAGRGPGLPVPQARARHAARRPRSRIGSTSRARWMIGDILDDVEAGRRAGCRSVLLDVGNETDVAALAAARRRSIALPTCSRPRAAHIRPPVRSRSKRRRPLRRRSCSEQAPPAAVPRARRRAGLAPCAQRARGAPRQPRRRADDDAGAARPSATRLPAARITLLASPAGAAAGAAPADARRDDRMARAVGQAAPSPRRTARRCRLRSSAA